jgi:glycerol-3-phosphate dehydrogenase
MVSVAGGKLTVHRLIARDVLRRLVHDVRPRRLRADRALLAAGTGDASDLRRVVDNATFSHLLRLYGAQASGLLRYGARFPDAFERIHADGPDVWAQVYFAREAEWAVTVEDVARRRTTLSVRGLCDDPTARRLAEALDRIPVEP